jgi:hypothetical protein
MSEQVLTTILASFIPIVLTTFVAWFERRNEESRRSQAIESAKQHIDFLRSYLVTQKLASTPEQFLAIKRKVSDEIDQIMAELAAELGDIEKTLPHNGGSSSLISLFLLYRLNTWQASAFRVLFYLSLILSTIVSALMTNFTITDLSNPFAARIVAAVIIVLPFVLITVLFRWLAIRSHGAGATLSHGSA